MQFRSKAKQKNQNPRLRSWHLAVLSTGEFLLLSLAGGFLGLAVIFAGVPFFRGYVGVFPLTSLTLVLSLGVSLAVGFLAALLPAAWRAARVSVAEALQLVE